MRGDQDVAWYTFEEREALLKTRQQIRVCGELVVGRGDRSQAVGVNHVETLRPFAGFPRPACPAGSVSGREMRSDLEVADMQNVAVREVLNVFNPRD